MDRATAWTRRNRDDQPRAVRRIDKSTLGKGTLSIALGGLGFTLTGLLLSGLANASKPTTAHLDTLGRPRVFVGGYGIVSSLGPNIATNWDALLHGRSGIVHVPEYEQAGLKSQIAGLVKEDGVDQLMPSKLYRKLSPVARYAYVAAREAMIMSGMITADDLDGFAAERQPLPHFSTPDVAIVGAQGGTSMDHIIRGHKDRAHPFDVHATMTSSGVAALHDLTGAQGASFSIGSACASSAHAIGLAGKMIRWGEAELVIAGGSDEVHLGQTKMFDTARALCTDSNENPAYGSRPWEESRSGFVISGGGAYLILGTREAIEARGGMVLAELLGAGATSDGPVKGKLGSAAPSGEGATRCMQQALDEAEVVLGDRPSIDLVNAHATSTGAGDPIELNAIAAAIGGNIPIVGTKALTGHPLGGAGSIEAVLSLMMQQHGIITPQINHHDPVAEIAEHGFIVHTKTERKRQPRVMSNSFGFGATNATLLFGESEDLWLELSAL